MQRYDVRVDLFLNDRMVVPYCKDPNIVAKVEGNMMLEGGSVATGLNIRKIVIFTFRQGEFHASPTRWERHLKDKRYRLDEWMIGDVDGSGGWRRRTRVALCES